MVDRERGADGGSRLRIALLSWRDEQHPEAGGAERFLARVADGLAERGHQVTVRSAAVPGSPRDLAEPGIVISRRGNRRTVYPRTFFWLLRKRRQFDVVVDVQNGLPFWAPLTGVRTVNLTHHLHREQWPEVFGPKRARLGWWLESRLAPAVYRRCDYIAVSQATRADLAGIGVAADRVTVVHNGVDRPLPQADSPIAERSPTPRLLVLGRLVPHKRVELAIDVVAQLRERYPDLRLDIAGGGYWEPALRCHARRRQVADRVHFHGVVDEATKHDLLAAAWLHLLPSVKEGWGLVVVEAGVHATPTVAFRSAGGTTESVLDGRTGLLAEDPAGFVAATARLLDAPQLRARLGAAAQHHAGRFSWEETVTALEARLWAALDSVPARDPRSLAGVRALPHRRVATPGGIIDRDAAAG